MNGEEGAVAVQKKDGKNQWWLELWCIVHGKQIQIVYYTY